MHLLTKFTNCSTWLAEQGVVKSRHKLFSFSIFGGKQTQFPDKSSVNPFLQTQNPKESLYFESEHVKQ